MLRILQFLDQACVDTKLYWRIRSIDDRNEYEIEWRKELPTPWRLRQLGNLFWEFSTHQDLCANLKKHQIDIKHFYKVLKQTILVQVAFADKIVKDASKLLGQTEVEQAIKENQKFMNLLEKAITNLKGSRQLPVKESPLHKAPKLRLITKNT